MKDYKNADKRGKTNEEKEESNDTTYNSRHVIL